MNKKQTSSFNRPLLAVAAFCDLSAPRTQLGISCRRAIARNDLVGSGIVEYLPQRPQDVDHADVDRVDIASPMIPEEPAQCRHLALFARLTDLRRRQLLARMQIAQSQSVLTWLSC